MVAKKHHWIFICYFCLQHEMKHHRGRTQHTELADCLTMSIKSLIFHRFSKILIIDTFLRKHRKLDFVLSTYFCNILTTSNIWVGITRKSEVCIVGTYRNVYIFPEKHRNCQNYTHTYDICNFGSVAVLALMLLICMVTRM